MSLVAIEDLKPAEIEEILDRAAEIENGKFSGTELQGKVICTAFFEPSTRTRLSFETAAHRLGAQVIGFSDASSTSDKKGESLEDTIRVLSGYADAIVMRHTMKGAAAQALQFAEVPVINAGDGAGQHPTQTLLDLFTMRQWRGNLDGIKVAVIGDLKYGRTVHSLVPALRMFGAQVKAVPASGLNLPKDLECPITTLSEAMGWADVLYATRVQDERIIGKVDVKAAKREVRIDAQSLEAANFRGIVMHPLPRREELAEDVDGLPSAKYFVQARNGVPVRMAILEKSLGEQK